MRASLLQSLLVIAAVVSLGAGCGDEIHNYYGDDGTVVVPDGGGGPCDPACSATQTCLEGACVATSTLCSASNITGVCGSGTTCFMGGCVPTASLCSTATPTGPCPVSETCLQGTCTKTSELCSTANKTGKCPSGQTCQDGVCGIEGLEPCQQHVYTKQPMIGTRSGTTAPKTVVNGALVDPGDPSVGLTSWPTWKQKGQITVDGLKFRDSNGNGVLDPYEDWRLPEICRARDLVTRMNLDQKIGVMQESSVFGGSGTNDDLD